MICQTLADCEPAAVLLHDVEQQHAIVGGIAADAPVVEELPGVLLAVIAAGQIVYRDDNYLGAVALLFQRPGSIVYELLCARRQRPGLVVYVEVLAGLERAAVGQGAAGEGKNKHERQKRGKILSHRHQLNVSGGYTPAKVASSLVGNLL